MDQVVTTGELSIAILPAASGASIRPALASAASIDRSVIGGTTAVNCVSSGLERIGKALGTL